MNRKIIQGLTYSLALAIVFSTLALADGGNRNATDNHTKAFTTEFGAKVRLLQLEASVTRNIAWGEQVISMVKEKNASLDTSDLEATLAQLRALEIEINSTTPAQGDEAAQNFADMKSDAINLTKEFRDSAHALLKDADIQGMKTKLGKMNGNETTHLGQEIESARKQYNAERLADLLIAANVSDPALIDKVKNGNATIAEIRDALKNDLSGLSPKQRNQAMLAIKEKAVKTSVFMRAVADKVAMNRMNRTEVRLEKRLNASEDLNLSDKVRERLENRTRLVETRMNRFVNQTEKKIDKIENITDKRIDNLDKKENRFENASNRTTARLDNRLDSKNLTDEQRQVTENRMGNVQNKTADMGQRTAERENLIRDRAGRMQKALNDSIGGDNQ